MPRRAGYGNSEKSKRASRGTKVLGTKFKRRKPQGKRKRRQSRLRYSKVQSVTGARYVAMLARERGSSHRGNDGTRRKKARGHQKKTRTEDDTKIEKYIAKEAEKGGL